MRTKILILVGAVLLLALAACTSATTEAPALPEAADNACPTAEPCPTCEACPAPPEIPAPVVEAVPFEAEWANSPHNDVTAEAFVHWNEEDPAEVPTRCAQCHSSSGYLDFLGADGSEAGVVDAAVPVGETVNCEACHNPVAASLSEVTFPSGVAISGLGGEARCMVCHQGRAAMTTVDAQIEKFGVTEDVDKVVEPIVDGDQTTNFGFINIHYFPAAATLYAGEVMGGYQYPGKVYDTKNTHVPGYDTCIGCHNQHTLEVKVEECAVCHEGVTSVEDLKNVRMVSSAPDYDGDGDVTEGMFYELEGLKETLYTTIQAYAKDVAGVGILYDPATYPYFLADADGDGTADQTEEGNAAGYSTWTARLLKAAYNYQLATKDPGNFAHGNKYVVQLLNDSINDLNEALPTMMDTSMLHRDDAGHFAGNTEAFRHWDEEGAVPGSCAKCHSSAGLPMFLKEGATISVPTANGFLCSTCHNEEEWPNLYVVDSVTFPSGAKVTFGEGENANVCLLCHQGRESTVSVNKAIGSTAPDEVPLNAEGKPSLGFRNVHYFAAGATLFGTEAKGAYEFEGKEYAGLNPHPVNKCTDCHDKHALEPKLESCAGCHGDVELEAIRMPATLDYDGDGDTTEGVKGELDGLAEKLFEALNVYTAAQGFPGIVYNSASYPYFFEDADGDGTADKDAEGASVRFTQFTPTLLKGAYNYQYYQKDPGAFVHNSKYVAQILIDSIEALGGETTGLTRP
jgi:hypothetical protein